MEDGFTRLVTREARSNFGFLGDSLRVKAAEVNRVD